MAAVVNKTITETAPDYQNDAVKLINMILPKMKKVLAR